MNDQPQISVLAAAPVNIQWPQPNGLKDSKTLIYDYFEWFVTPCNK